MQQLLATLPDPGPMPADLVDRITASLAAEQAHRGPLSDHETAGGPTSLPSVGSAPSGASPSPEWSSPARAPHGTHVSRGWLLGLSAAAAAVAIGGVAALNLLGPAGGDAGGSLAFGHFPVEATAGAAQGLAGGSGNPSGASSPHASVPAAPVGPDAESEAGGGSSAPDGSTPALTTHIQVSTVDYQRDTLVAQGTQLLGKRTAALPFLGAESPAIGPIGTPLGVTHCLEALGVTAQRAVVDVARFDGAPAAVIVTDGPGGREVRVVSRQCGAPTSGDVVLAGPLSLR